MGGHIPRMGERRSMYRVLGERDNMEDPSAEGSIILRWIFRKCVGDMDWIDLAQDRDRWRALVNVEMNLRFRYNAGNFLIR